MRYIAFIWFVAISISSPNVYCDTLSAKIDALIEQRLPHATLGVLVKDAQTGTVIYNKNANKLLSPASGTKLFTAAAALYQLTPNYSFVTTLSKKNNDIYVTFTGSPSLTSDNLIELISHLSKNNIKIINGNIIIDSSRYKPPYYAGGDSYDDLGWYYSAPSSAVVLNENAVAYEFISPETLGMQVQVKPKTPEITLNIINKIITADKEQLKQCNLNIDIQSDNTLKLFGCLPATKDPLVMKLAITDPVSLAKQVIKKAIDNNNIILNGKIIRGKTPVDAQLIVSYQSKNLTQLITHMLQESDNLYANSFYKQLAYSVTGEGSFKKGAYAIKKILSDHTHMDMTQLELADGAGARYNLISPEQMVILLTDLYNNPSLQAIILKALPQAGVSGSLKDRMKKTVLEKNVYAKTGTMHDISSLSGYMKYPNNKTLIFSIIINGINTPIGNAKSLEEQILQKITEELNLAYN